MEVVDLRACREARGLSLDDVYASTKISVPLLAAVEESDFSSLPPPVYTRRFITAYADYLGQPSEPILAEYERYLETVPAFLFHPVSVPATNLGKEPIHSQRRSGGLIKNFILAGVAAMVLLTLIIPNLRNTFFQGAITLRESVVSRPEVKPAVDNRPETPLSLPATGKNEAAVTTADNREHLIIEAHELTWLRIRTDKDPPHQLLMNPGERIERFAERNFVLDIGNAGGVELHLQGKNLGRLGKSGEVVRLRLP